MKKLWPLETDPDDPNSPHVTVRCARCPWSFFVSKDDPRLPDGPFFCIEHQDKPAAHEKASDYTEADLVCDRCGAKLSVRGTSREDALAKLWKAVTEQRWTSTFDGAPHDLCGTCTAS